MPVAASELKVYRSVVINDLPTNGGIMSSLLAGDGVANAIFPNVSEADRVAGLTTLRKAFYKVANDLDTSLLNSKLYITKETDGDDAICMFAGTHSDTQGDVTGAEDLYGCGSLNSDALAGATTLDVLVEDWANMPIFRDGDEIRVSNKTDVSSVGDEEFHTINGAPFVVGNVVTLTLTSATAVDFAAADTKVSSVLAVGAIEGSYSGFSVTSVSGVYDDTTYPVLVDSIGGIHETYTLTFSSSTEFSCVGSASGSLGSGAITSSFQPNNTSFSKPFFKLDANGFSGTFAAGDTVEFTTVPASTPIWFKRIVPAGATSISGNNFVFALEGESA